MGGYCWGRADIEEGMQFLDLASAWQVGTTPDSNRCHAPPTLSPLLLSFLTINVPVVYMSRDVMILMGANPLQGPLKGLGPENGDIFGPEIATSKAIVI